MSLVRHCDMNRNPTPVIAQGLFSYQIGGSERVGADLAIEFKRRGFRVICFAFYDTDGPIREELNAAGIECVDLNYKTRQRLTRRLTFQIEFLRFLLRFRVDALLVHHATALILCGIPAGLARVRRVAMIEHGLHQLRDRPDYRRSATRYCRYADVIIGVDQTIVRYFHEHMAVPSGRLRYIPNGVTLRPRDLQLRTATRNQLGLGAEEFAFLFVGRLQPEKDVTTLLKAFGALPITASNRARLLIVGDGPQRSMLELLAHELNIADRVAFLGARQDVPNFLSAADALVMTSITEGQPMALLEAMAAELPCIATRVGGIPALLEHGAGILTSPSSQDETTAAMAEMLVNDALRATCIARAAKRIADKHSLRIVAGDYVDALGLLSL